MIVGVISVIGALFLVSSNSQFRQLGLSKGIKLALIWAVIIVGLVLTIQLFGIQSRS